MKYTLNINGEKKDVDVDPETPLLWVLRDDLGLTGTKYSCGISMCGACTVHVDGTALRSCVYPVQFVGESEVTTIEGLSTDQSNPVQRAWIDLDVPQCGYCQAGQIMTAAALLQRDPNPTDEVIDETMTNICRCGTYKRIRKAVKLAAEYKANTT